MNSNNDMNQPLVGGNQVSGFTLNGEQGRGGREVAHSYHQQIPPPQQQFPTYTYQNPVPQSQPGHVPYGRWSDDIGSCFDNWSICCTATFCPCIRFAETLDRVGIMSYRSAFWIYFSLLITLVTLSYSQRYVYDEYVPIVALLVQLPAVVLILIRAHYRTKLRMIYGIPGSNAGDICCHIWCRECALSQEGRHVDRDYGLQV